MAQARDADAYRVLTFEAPWPAGYLEDQCALFRCMSTDEPHGETTNILLSDEDHSDILSDI